MRFTYDFTIYAGPKNKSGQTIFYYRLRDERGRRLAGKSTGKTSRSSARRWIIAEMQAGRIGPRSSRLFSEFAQHWWLPGKCSYLTTAANNGRAIGAHHASVQRSYLTTHILPYFGPLRLEEIRVADIEDWRLSLYQKLSPASAANVFSCLRTMLGEAERLELIVTNPIRKVKAPRVSPQRREVLSGKEVAELFRAKHWRNPIAYAANIFAASTGARLGECLALRGEDLSSGYVTIRHSIGRREGLKCTKTGVERTVPLPRITERVLERLRRRNGEGFLFSSNGGTRPLYHKTVTRALREALLDMHIEEDEIRRRGLTFHSWRHFYNTMLLHHGVPMHITQQIVGHRSTGSTDRYHAQQSGQMLSLRPVVDTAVKEYLA